MSSMDRIRRDAMDKYGPAPTTPAEALAHVLAVHQDTPNGRLVVQVTSGIYGDGVQTGLTMGDLRAIYAALPRA